MLWLLVLLQGPALVWATPPDVVSTADSVQRNVAFVPEALPRTAMEDTPQDGLVRLPLENADATACRVGEWLGVTIHEAFRLPRRYGVDIRHSLGLVSLVSMVRRHVSAGHSHVQSIVPARPQRHAGYATLLAVPEVLDAHALTANIVDLSGVGGHYFAYNVPVGMSTQEFLSAVSTQLDCDVEDVHVFIAGDRYARPLHTRLDAQHGDVITVLRSGVLPRAPTFADSLFEAGTLWDALEDMPSFACQPCVALWFRDSLDVYCQDLFPGQDLLDVVSRRYKTPVSRLLLQSVAELAPISVFGEACHSLTVITEHEQAIEDDGRPTDAALAGRTIVFDLRPVGLPPKVLWLSHDRFQVDALLRECIVQPSQGYRYNIIEVANEGPTSPLVVEVRAARDERVHDWTICTRHCPALSVGNALFIPHATAAVAAVPTPRPVQLVAQVVEASSSDSETSQGLDVRPTIVGKVLVLALEHVGIVLDFELTAPAAVEELTDRAWSDLPRPFCLRYPNLVEVKPQPSSEWATLLALPQWTVREAIVVFDTSHIDGRLFPVLFPGAAAFERICELAGLTDDASFQVFAYGAAEPLQVGDVLPALDHGSILFLPLHRNSPPPPGATLATMLASQAGWDASVAVPLGPGGPRGNYVCVVLEEGHRLYSLRTNRGQHFLEDLSEAYDIPLHWNTAGSARPAVDDACIRGYRCKGVAWVSRDFPNVPVPPGLHNPGDFTVLLDCRPLLQGWHQWPVQNFHCSHSDLTEAYEVFAPEDFQVQVEGAHIEGDNLQVRRGQVLVLMWAPATTSCEEDHEQRLPSPGTDGETDNGDRSPSVSDHARHGVPAPSNGSLRNRSRSPAPTTSMRNISLVILPAQVTATAASLQADSGICSHCWTSLLPSYAWTSPCLIVAGVGCVIVVTAIRWPVLCVLRNALQHGAAHLSKYAHFASWRAGRRGARGSAATKRTIAVEHPSTQSICSSRRCRLLIEPLTANRAEQAAFDDLRHLAGQIGLPWPYLRNIHAHDSPDAMPAHAFEPAVAPPAAMHFAILVPEYSPEQICVNSALPITVNVMLRLVQQQREVFRAERFPFLIPAIPQPALQWGLLVAAPAWAPRATVVVLDLQALDGRLFAIHVPTVVPCWFLLQLARVPPGVEVHVIVGFDVTPVPRARDLHLIQGQCITIVPAHRLPDPISTLDQLLLSPATWGPGPAYPRRQTLEAYCLATEGNHSLYVPEPDRPLRFRDGAAAECRIPPQECRLVPAASPVLDSMTQGVRCSTVLATFRQWPARQPDQVAIVDCRALFQGWTLRRLHDGRIDISTLEEELGDFAPPDWSVLVLGPRDEYGHRVVADGEVLCAVYVHTPADGPVALVRTGAHDTIAAPEDVHLPSTAASSGDRQEPRAPLPQRRNTPAVAGHGTGTSHGLRLLLRGLLGIACVHPGRAVPNSPLTVDTYPENHAHAGRADMWNSGDANDGHSAGPLALTSVLPSNRRVSTGDVVGGRPVPTPCRARVRTPCPSDCLPEPVRFGGAIAKPLGDVFLGPTLLEIALRDASFQPLWEAATLLETLIQHFQETQQHESRPAVDECLDSTHVPNHVLPAPTTAAVVSLSHGIAVTPFQQDCLTLEGLLTFPDTAAEDWLDNDLALITRDPYVPLAQRTDFFNIRTWHACACPKPAALHIYTDGSATDGGASLAPCAWSFTVWVDTGADLLLLGFAAEVAAAPTTPYFIGEGVDDALTGEQLLALAWTFAWIIEHAPSYAVGVCVHYDAMSAGMGAFGSWRPPRHGAPTTDEAAGPDLSTFLISLRQIAEQRVPLQHAHVRGHSGHLGNELADQLAKRARRQPLGDGERLAPLWLSSLHKHPLSRWAWLLFSHGTDLPTLFAMESEASRMQAQDLRPSAAPLPRHQQGRSEETSVAIRLRAVSYNALTLREASMSGSRVLSNVGLRVTGRKELLKRQLSDLRPIFVGLQETRLPESSVQQDSEYLILQSAATDAGTLGIALWVSLKEPYAHHKGEPLHLQRGHCNVYGFSPRHIAVAITAPFLRMVVLVAHAPNSLRKPVQEVEEFWRQRAAEIERRPAGSDFLILADANAHVGRPSTDHVGEHQFEAENMPGEVFHAFLHRVGGLLPSTFEQFHSGDGHTWVAPGGARHRLDFVIVPLAWACFSMRSAVVYELESLQYRDDHFPVFLEASFATSSPRGPPPASMPKTGRPSKPATGAERQQALNALSQYAPPSWDVNVDQHYQGLASFWQHVGGVMDNQHKCGARQPYLSETTHSLVLLRRALRHYLRAERRTRRSCLLMLGFAAFVLHQQGATFSTTQLDTVQRWFFVLDHSEAEALFRLHHLGHYLRRFVAADRARYLGGLAAQVSAQDVRNPAALFASVRRAFPAVATGRRTTYQPLPAVRDEDEQLVVTAEDRIEVWRSYFAAQEAGIAVTGPQYVDAVQAGKRPSDEPVFDLNVLPSLGDVESLILDSNRGRAVGADLVTVETLQLHVPKTSRQLLPVLLKAGLGLCEPIPFRGGELIALAKKAGAAFQCREFRSILISSIPGKLYHRKVREQLSCTLRRHRHELHSGTLPGEGIECISLATKTFQHHCEAAHTPWALVFFDLASAFYQVVREAVAPGCNGDRELLALLHSLHLPPRALQELRGHLTQMALLPRLAASPHLVAIVNDMFRGTYLAGPLHLRGAEHDPEIQRLMPSSALLCQLFLLLLMKTLPALDWPLWFRPRAHVIRGLPPNRIRTYPVPPGLTTLSAPLPTHPVCSCSQGYREGLRESRSEPVRWV